MKLDTTSGRAKAKKLELKRIEANKRRFGLKAEPSKPSKDKKDEAKA